MEYVAPRAIENLSPVYVRYGLSGNYQNIPKFENSFDEFKFYLSEIGKLKTLYDSNPNNLNDQINLATAYMGLANSITPFAFFGDVRIKDIAESHFFKAREVLQDYMPDGDNDPALQHYLALLHQQQATYWLATGYKEQAASGYLQSISYYKKLAERFPDNVSWHREIGMNLLALTESYPASSDDLSLLVKEFPEGKKLLDSYPKEIRNRAATALALELGMDAMEKSVELLPSFVKLQCELAQTKAKTVDALKQLDMAQQAKAYTDTKLKDYCSTADQNEKRINSQRAANIVETLQLQNTISADQLQAIRIFESRWFNELNNDVDTVRYLAYWYGALGKIAWMKPINNGDKLTDQFHEMGLNLNRYAFLLFITDEKFVGDINESFAYFNNKNKDYENSNPPIAISNNSIQIVPTYYDERELKTKGIGFFYQSLTEKIIKQYERRL